MTPRPLETGEVVEMTIHLAMYNPDIARMPRAINSIAWTWMIRGLITDAPIHGSQISRIHARRREVENIDDHSVSEGGRNGRGGI
jgi:hypothetical protein